MNTRTPLIRAALATAFVGCALIFTHLSPASPAHASETMSVDTRAPLHATLLPVVSVFAEATHPGGIVAMRIAATEALPVTLLPTLYVTARSADFSAAPPMRVAAATQRVRAQNPIDMRVVADDDGARTLTRADAVRAKLVDGAPALRTCMLPR